MHSIWLCLQGKFMLRWVKLNYFVHWIIIFSQLVFTCSTLTIKTPKRRLTPCSCVSFINFEHVNAGYFINDYLDAFFRWFRIQVYIFRPNYLENFYCDLPFFRENDTWCSTCVVNTAFCFLFLHFMIWE